MVEESEDAGGGGESDDVGEGVMIFRRVGGMLGREGDVWEGVGILGREWGE